MLKIAEEVKSINENLKTIAVNQALIYTKLLQLEKQYHSITANTPTGHQ